MNTIKTILLFSLIFGVIAGGAVAYDFELGFPPLDGAIVRIAGLLWQSTEPPNTTAWYYVTHSTFTTDPASAEPIADVNISAGEIYYRQNLAEGACSWVFIITGTTPADAHSKVLSTDLNGFDITGSGKKIYLAAQPLASTVEKCHINFDLNVFG